MTSCRMTRFRKLWRLWPLLAALWVALLTPPVVAGVADTPLHPSTGLVRVGYGLPQAAKTVELRVFDAWGRPMGTYSLADDKLGEGVYLNLRQGIYQCQLVADGVVAAKERLLITK
jgi:hypothetical protein